MPFERHEYALKAEMEMALPKKCLNSSPADFSQNTSKRNVLKGTFNSQQTNRHKVQNEICLVGCKIHWVVEVFLEDKNFGEKQGEVDI